MSINPGARRLWTKNNGEILAVRVVRLANAHSYYVFPVDRLGVDVVGGSTQVASAKQLTEVVPLAELTGEQVAFAAKNRLNVLVFDNLPAGKLLVCQLNTITEEWVNVRYKSSILNRKSHNVYLMPTAQFHLLSPSELRRASVVSDQINNADDAVKHYVNALAPVKPEESDTLRTAGAKRGFILWNPKSTHAPTVVHPTLEKAKEVQRLMATRCPNEFFHICPVGPGLAIVTQPQEQFA